MNIQELKNSGNIIYDAIGGSIAYGTNTPQSDKDIRGIYKTPISECLSLSQPQEQISDEKNDTVYYDLKRFFILMQTANPNLIEMLWYPKDCINYCSPKMEELIENRNVFISKKAYFSHSQYALSQVKRARGANKKVHNPMPKEMPRKEDFCWFISGVNENFENDDHKYWFFNNLKNLVRLLSNQNNP